MEKNKYVRPSERFGDFVVLYWAIDNAGLLPHGSTTADVTDEIREKYDKRFDPESGVMADGKTKTE